MTYKLPPGWKRGEPLCWGGEGQRYRAHIHRELGEDWPEIAALAFDSLDKAKAFNEWWKAQR